MFTVEEHAFRTHKSSDSLQDDGLWVTAKRYTTKDSSLNGKGLTLLFTHCVGGHKELWEPVLEQLFQLQQSKDEMCRIREAWSFDRQNHGDAAVLNREALVSRLGGVPLDEWAAALISFVRSDFMKGHRIIPVGHSAGATAWMLTTKGFPITDVPYVSMILVESTMVTRETFNSELEDRMSHMEFVMAATSARRDSWPSREDALKYFGKRIPWGTWDPRALKVLVDHGLRDSSDGRGVILKCDKRQEAISYPDIEPHFECALQVGRVCSAVPIHLIWGTRNDLVPDFIQDSLCDKSQGRTVASVAKVEEAGHMVVQEQPDLLAQAIAKALDMALSPGSSLLSKL